MPHLHTVDAQSIAAAQYQAYLDRMQANLLARKAAEARQAPPPPTFDSLIDADGNPQENPQEEAPDERKEDGEGGDEASEGFGTHYA